MMPSVLRTICCLVAVWCSIQTSVAQEEGIASYYHAKFHGRKMSSGKIHNKEELVAAHRSLPFGTYVKVTNLSNRKNVIVRIEDRGPFRRGWIIDLSQGAAERLDFVEKGITKVRLEIVPGPVDYSYLQHLYTDIPSLNTDEISPRLPSRAPAKVIPVHKKKKKKFMGLFYVKNDK